MTSNGHGFGSQRASPEDVRLILGAIDEVKALEILVLHPTVAQLEEAALWVSGEASGSGQEARPTEPIVAAICGIVLAARRGREGGAQVLQ